MDTIGHFRRTVLIQKTCYIKLLFGWVLVKVPNTFFSATGVCKLTVINWGKWCKKCVEPHSSTILSALIINELPLRCKPRGGNINFSTPSLFVCS